MVNMPFSLYVSAIYLILKSLYKEIYENKVKVKIIVYKVPQ